MKSRLILATALAVSLSACATTTQPTYGSAYPNPSSSPGYQQPARCYDCGRIERIEIVSGARANSRTGAVLGGVVGAVAGHELADDESDGRQNSATVVGAVAGAVAGNAIENSVVRETYNIHVRMDDGRMLVFNRNSLAAGIREGAYVRVEGNNLVSI